MGHAARAARAALGGAALAAAAAGRLAAQPDARGPARVDAARAAGAPADTARADTAPAGAPAAVPRVEGGAGGWEVAPFVGYGARSPTRFWGVTPGRNHLMLGVQFARPLGRAGGVSIAWAPNVVPLFVLTNNPLPEVAGARRARAGGARGGRVPACESTRCGPVYGVAAAPAGVRLDARVLPALRVYGAAAIGVVMFSRNVPVDDARRLNATLEWGVGAIVPAGAQVAVQAGFKYHHLSNAYTANRNPGVDGRVFHAGLVWRVGAGRTRR